MKLSAIVERSGGAFLFAGDGAKEYIGNHYKGDKMVGWLLWSPETLELLEKLNPKCYVVHGKDSAVNSVHPGNHVANTMRDVCKNKLKNTNNLSEKEISWLQMMLGGCRHGKQKDCS